MNEPKATFDVVRLTKLTRRTMQPQDARLRYRLARIGAVLGVQQVAWRCHLTDLKGLALCLANKGWSLTRRNPRKVIYINR